MQSVRKEVFRMSSSKKKNNAKGGLSDRFYTIIAIVIVVVLAASLITAVSQNIVKSGRFFPAVKVGDDKVYPHEVNFYYINSYMNFVQSYGDYLSWVGLDPSLPLKAQKHSEDKTWHDYFLEAATNSVHEIKALYREATLAGNTISEEHVQQIDSDIASLEASVEAQNMSLDYYLSSTYGKQMTLDEYKRIMTESYIAQEYSLQRYNGFEYSDDDIMDYYQSNKRNFDIVDYRSFFFSSAPEGTSPTQEEIDNAKTSAKSLAEIMLSAITDEQSFIKLSLQNATDEQKSLYEDESYTLREGVPYSSTPNVDVGDWLFDSSRAPGDTTMIETDSGYYVLYMKARYRNDYNTVNVRHILIQFDLDEGATEATDEQKSAAKASAEAILSEWESGDKTESSFAELAKEHSEDTGSIENSGLYENISKGLMVKNFEDWCFDSSRSVGDTGIVETEYGYHVMYFVSHGRPYWKVQVETEVRNNDFTDFTDETKDKYPLSRNSIGLMAVGLPG